MTAKEALEIFNKSDMCYGDKCPVECCVDCQYNNTEDEFLEMIR